MTKYVSEVQEEFLNDVPQHSDFQRKAALAGTVAVGAGSGLVLAQSPGRADAISDITSGVTAMNGIYTAATPIAVGVVVFACAVLVVKRLLYS